MKNNFLTTLTGFLMAFADSVPGVSGGTIAYILGKYDELIESINILTSKNSLKEKQGAITFLAKLLIGWGVGLVMAVFLITSLLHNHIYEMTSLFIGFIAFSIPFIIKEEKHTIKGKYFDMIFIVIGALLVFAISLNSSKNLSFNLDDNPLLYLYIFIAGAIAISAMLLPGISGSTILIILGLYSTIMTSIKDTLKFDFSNIFIVTAFGIGILFGLKYSSKLINKALHNYRSKVVYTIIGLMIGSIYSLIIGPTTLVDEVTEKSLNLDPLSISTFSFIFFIIGIVIVYSLDKLKHIIENKNQH